MAIGLKYSRVICFMFALVVLPKVTSAALVVSDGFSAATHPTNSRSVAAGTGIPFYTVNTIGSAAITTDTGVNTLNSEALLINGSSGSNTAVVGPLGGVASLATTGSSITLDFRYRFNNTPTSSASILRFGFHNSQGTTVTGDNLPALSDNDVGYYAQFGTLATAVNSLYYQESGGQTTIFANNDRTAINSAIFPGFADQSVHTVSFSMTRTNATTITLSLAVDGGTAVTATTTTSLLSSFDQVGFSTGFATTNPNVLIDDVVVNATNFTAAVPEPSTIGLSLAGMMGFLAYRRRK